MKKQIGTLVSWILVLLAVLLLAVRGEMVMLVLLSVVSLLLAGGVMWLRDHRAALTPDPEKQ